MTGIEAAIAALTAWIGLIAAHEYARHRAYRSFRPIRINLVRGWLVIGPMPTPRPTAPSSDTDPGDGPAAIDSP